MGRGGGLDCRGCSKMEGSSTDLRNLPFCRSRGRAVQGAMVRLRWPPRHRPPGRRARLLLPPGPYRAGERFVVIVCSFWKYSAVPNHGAGSIS